MRSKSELFGLIVLSLFVTVLVGLKTTQSAEPLYITGKVQSASSGRPIPSLWVIIYEGETVKGRSLTGDDGKYYIGALDRREYKIAVRRGNQTLFQEMIRLPQNERYDIRVRE